MHPRSNDAAELFGRLRWSGSRAAALVPLAGRWSGDRWPTARFGSKRCRASIPGLEFWRPLKLEVRVELSWLISDLQEPTIQQAKVLLLLICFARTV